MMLQARPRFARALGRFRGPAEKTKESGARSLTHRTARFRSSSPSGTPAVARHCSRRKNRPVRTTCSLVVSPLMVRSRSYRLGGPRYENSLGPKQVPAIRFPHSGTREAKLLTSRSRVSSLFRDLAITEAGLRMCSLWLDLDKESVSGAFAPWHQQNRRVLPPLGEERAHFEVTSFAMASSTPSGAMLPVTPAGPTLFAIKICLLHRN